MISVHHSLTWSSITLPSPLPPGRIHPDCLDVNSNQAIALLIKLDLREDSSWFCVSKTVESVPIILSSADEHPVLCGDLLAPSALPWCHGEQKFLER